MSVCGGGLHGGNRCRHLSVAMYNDHETFLVMSAV